MQEEIDQKRKAGIVVLIARRGSIAHFKAYGITRHLDNHLNG